MDLDATKIAVLGTLGGAVIAGICTVTVAFINKRSEERKHFRELVIKTASDNWKYVAENSTSTVMPPLHTYIVNTVQMCDLALSKNLSPEEVKQKLKASSKIMDIMIEHSSNMVKKK